MLKINIQYSLIKRYGFYKETAVTVNQSVLALSVQTVRRFSQATSL